MYNNKYICEKERKYYVYKKQSAATTNFIQSTPVGFVVFINVRTLKEPAKALFLWSKYPYFKGEIFTRKNNVSH